MNVIRFISYILLMIAFFCQNCRYSEKSTKRQYLLQFNTPSDQGVLYGDIFLIDDNKDTIYRLRYPIHERWASRLKNKIFPNQNVNTIHDNWSCELYDFFSQYDILDEVENYSSFNEILSVTFEKMQLKDEKLALKFIMNNLFIPDLYQSSSDTDWTKCEDLYRNKIKQVLNDQDKKNFEHTPYKLLGLDSCQLVEILSIDSIVQSLKQHQYIIAASSCVLHETDNDKTDEILVTKPYYLIEFNTGGKYLSVRIELINKLYYYHWIDL